MNKAALLVAIVMATGCNHVTTKVPGVLDLRSDGKEAPLAKAPPQTTPALTRNGIDGILYGDGVVAMGSEVSVVDRKYWILRLIGILNESATEEIAVALGDEAIRNVKIGDQLSGADIIMSLVANLIPGVNAVGLIMPPMDVTFSGTRIQTAPALETPPTDSAVTP